MSIEITEKSLDLALIKAAGQLGITSDRLAYEVIKEQKILWGLLGSSIVIKAWVKDESKNHSERSRSSSRRRKESSEEPKAASIDPETLKEMEDFCQNLCTLMLQDENVKISVEQNKKTYVFSCDNDFIAERMKKNPKIAESIEQILLRAFKRKIPGRSIRIFFEAKDVRQNKKEELKALARKLSNKAAKSRKTIALNYKYAYDRKIIHTALDSDNRVYTKSVGSGQSRKLLIIPVRNHEQQKPS